MNKDRDDQLRVVRFSDDREEHEPAKLTGAACKTYTSAWSSSITHSCAAATNLRSAASAMVDIWYTRSTASLKLIRCRRPPRDLSILPLRWRRAMRVANTPPRLHQRPSTAVLRNFPSCAYIFGCLFQVRTSMTIHTNQPENPEPIALI